MKNKIVKAKTKVKSKAKTKVKTLTVAQVSKIRSLANKGLSQREIGKRVGCSRSAVYYHLTK